MLAESNMRAARDMLPESVDESELVDFESYLGHNELELALDELDYVGQKHLCFGEFWRNLERAAEAMKLHGRASNFHKRFHDSQYESP